jgi:ferredoxin/flavodoxin
MELPAALSRRGFLVLSGIAAGMLLTSRKASARVVKAGGSLAHAQPRKALVAWYSQTRHTERYATLISRVWAKQGLVVDTHPLLFGDMPDVAGYDLIMVGTPVHYMDVPKNVSDWLANIPSIAGVGVASFATYGGKGDGQHNAALSLLGDLTAKGGIPLGMDTFGNMSAYPPTWSMGNSARTLKFRSKPDETTYNQVRAFASAVLDQYGRGQGIEVKSEFSFMEPFKGGVSRWLAGLMLGKHAIDKSQCIHCGTCVKACPVNAIDIDTPRIDTRRCILCFGCINNCPTGAHKWSTFGKPIYGFSELLKRNGVTIMEPAGIG